jgi:predicted MFS family arabinose efflux permease
VSTLACGLSDTYATLLISRAFAGIFGGLAAAMILAIIGDRFADARRGTATGAVMSGFAVASVVGLPLGLMLANHFGRGAPFIAIAVLCVPVGIAAAFLIPSFTGHRAHARSIRRDLHQVLTTRRHVIAFVFMFTLVMGTFTIIPFLAPYIVRNAGRSADDVPIIYLIAGICTFISLNALGRLADAYGKKPVFIAMAVMALLMTLTITNLPQVGLFAAIAAATGFMIAASGRMVPAQAMMLASATPALRGAFVNINSAVQHLAMSVAPVVAGSVMGGGETGPLTGYPIVGAIAASFSILSLILCNLLEPAPHDLPTPVTIPKPTVEPSGEALPATTNA